MPTYCTTPGDSVREYMEDRRFTSEHLAERLGLSTEELDAILAGRGRITDSIAEGLARVFSRPTHYWLNLQKLYDQSMSK